MPRTVDEAKYRGMLALGADVVRADCPGYDETEALAREEAAQTGRTFVSAFDDFSIMAGNGGSLAVEVLEDVPAARTFVLPVGGGGLASGFAFYARERLPGGADRGMPARALAGAAPLARPGRSRDRRFRRSRRRAAGVEGGMGALPFEVLRTRTDAVALLSEEEIFEGVRWLLQEHQYLVEPSAAVTVAACLTGKAGRLESPTVVVLSGRNVSLDTIRKILR